MTQSRSVHFWKLGLASVLAINGTLAFYRDCALAQITSDRTLGSESSQVTPQNSGAFQIDGGATRGTNLFHSFSQFSVPTNGVAYFNNAESIQNIISRVTGKFVSNIDGEIRANGTANLFLLNPSGIMFGPNASLNIGGSFVASTASSLNFADGNQFSATAPKTTPLLTVSVPIGLQFGATAAPIRNQSQASPDGATKNSDYTVGLQVKPGNTLALVGGDVTLEGGNLTAQGGRIELGSVAANSLVSLNPTNQGWILGYAGVQNYQNILLSKRTVNGSDVSSFVDASGEGGGNIQVRGRRVMLTENSYIVAITVGSKPGGDLTLNASESVELIGPLVVLETVTQGNGRGGDIRIDTKKLIVRDEVQVLTVTSDKGAGGQLIVNAGESVNLIGNSTSSGASVLSSETGGAGKAGDITINTGRLRIQGGAQVSTETSGSKPSPSSNQFIPATGQGGHLTVNASQSVELIGTSPDGSLVSGLFASTNGSGDAGKLTIATGQLIVRDGAKVTVSSEVPQDVTYLGDARNLGKAGELNVTARSILLDNQGQLAAQSDSGRGGNIKLQAQDLLLMRHNSQISTNAGDAKTGGDGGNITIKTPLLVAVPQENSHITANAYTGNGGRIQITTQGIFGFQFPQQPTKQSDITASSRFGVNGAVQINILDTDPSRGLVTLPTKLVNVNELLAQSCPSRGSGGRQMSQFTITGRGGLPPLPNEALRSNNTVALNWVTLDDRHAQRDLRAGTGAPPLPPSALSTQIVEATGWVINDKGQVVLTASAPTAIHNNSSLSTPATCPSLTSIGRN